MDEVIRVKHLTKDYGNGKGVFDINLSVREGEVYGFLGPNGAGKTTTIRNLMGFIRPDSGMCTIKGMSCFQSASLIQRYMGYLAGELAFLEDMKGQQMIDFIADMKQIYDRKRMRELMEMFELDPRGRIRKMSKGMKQKVGIVCAFMGNPQIIILDEPTSGLDPLMQNRFIDLILEEKKKGKTIFMSSHIFEEIEKTCDKTAIIRSGKIAAIENVAELRQKKNKNFCITFLDMDNMMRFQNESFTVCEVKGNQVTVVIQGEVGELLQTLAKYKVTDLDVKIPTLEETFLHYYGGDNNDIDSAV